MASLAPTYGRGAMTNTWTDIGNADLVLVMGGNAAEAHPCGFKWVTEAKAHNKARLIVVDPRYTRTAAVSDYYAPIRTGTDIAFMGGLINYLISNDKIQHEYVRNYTDVSFIVKEGFGFEDGLFSGYDADKRTYSDKSSWGYELDEQGFAKVDKTLEHPRCVFQLMKQHYSRYTPELASQICGMPQDKMLTVWEEIATCSAPGKTMTILYALGWTQHSIGAQIIRSAAMVQLLLGNVGMPGGGVNALRGHSNIQGLTDLGLLSNLLPGYMTLAGDAEQDFGTYIDKRALKPLRPGQTSYWQNYGKFHVSLMKAWYGKAATAENDWCYDYLPKLDFGGAGYDVLRMFDMMSRGEVHGYFCQGFNPIASLPDKNRVLKSLAKLKWLVVMDPLATETAEFWRNAGEFNEIDTASVETEVFRLPTTCFAEEDGSLVNSTRWLQWHWKAADAPGEARTDIEIMSGLFLRLRERYRTEGGAYADPILNLHWPYKVAHEPSPEEIAKEFNGYAVTDVTDASGAVIKAGQQLSGFGQLKDDGSTASGCWIFCGSWTEQGNQMARRDNSDPHHMKQHLGWAWAWPMNRRILYNRASADPAGKPWAANKKAVWWNGSSWTGTDVPDYGPTVAPEAGVNPFIMNPEGVARFFAVDKMAEGPFPEHYEPFETPIGVNPLHPNNKKVISSPAARIFDSVWDSLGEAKDYPYAATTYRLTEHFHFWTKHCRLNAIVQPEQFVEIGEALAKEKGIAAGDRVRVTSKRGYIECVAVVTKRIRPLQVNNQTVHHVGIPIHWGFTGVARPGFIANTLVPYLGDGNTQTPESKSFLVNLEKA
ncbi:formate dehydrogenase-N subunit alpha [Stutzerimonas nosocomialis]|nr:formate dehydrogenase-N subunit alpha [Stutzerimonas nosocomialis]